MTRKRTPLPGESDPRAVLNVFEVLGPDQRVLFRISRYFSADGATWVRHGPFTMLHPSGAVATAGSYQDGREEGLWQTWYENGQLAAEGMYYRGDECGYWRFWSRDGTEGPSIEYEHGEEVK